LNPLDVFTDPVTISVDGVPKGAKGTFAVMLVNPPSKLTYYLELGPSVAPGNSILMFKATGGGWTHTALTQLSIVKASRYGDYGLSISPPVQMVAPGTSAYFLLHVTGNYGPDGLEIRASGAPFSASISAGQGGNPEYELLTVSVRKDAAPGVYKGLVVGTSPWEHNASFMVIVSSGGPDIDLTLELKDILTSPGQDWPTLRLNATTGLSLVTNKTLTYRTLGLGILGTSELFNYDLSKDLILPIGNLKAATYLYLLLVQTPDMTYPKVLVGTLTMTAPVALLYINVAEDQYREGKLRPLGHRGPVGRQESVQALCRAGHRWWKERNFELHRPGRRRRAQHHLSHPAPGREPRACHVPFDDGALQGPWLRNDGSFDRDTAAFVRSRPSWRGNKDAHTRA
jgi:hypothetical protein